MTSRTTTAAALIRRASTLSLSAWIFIGLGLGILVGLFFGEPAAVFQPVAEIYVRMMQMSVLPYLVVSLVVGFGQLEPAQARRLALRAGALLLVTWAVTLTVISALPLAFPSVRSASFFSHSLVEPRQPFSIPDLYFTANPFHSLSNAVVPAVVLFSTMVGVALMGIRERERVLAPLRVLNGAITAITMFVIRLTPLGVFAIGAVAAGTMTGETLQRLQVYFVAFAAASILLAFLVLPLLVTAMTPFRYGEVTSIARDALLTAFAANNAFIVLPILVEHSKALIDKYGLQSADTDTAADVLVPILFNFPNAGKLLTLLFVPFAAWLAGVPFTSGNYAALFAAGVPSYFAKAQVALPFLMDLFGLPHDLFQLYIPTTILSGKFDSMVTAMNLLVFALLGAAAMGGFLVLQRRRLVRAAIGIAVGTVATVIAVALVLRVSVDTSYHRDVALKRMHAPRTTAGAIVHRDRSTVSPPADAPGTTPLARVRTRGVLRVGFDPGNTPFSFWNADGALVGFDIELAHQIADALGVKVEFVPVAWPDVPGVLRSGLIDVMPGVWYRPYWFASLRLSQPYMTGTMAVVTRDERRHEFATIDGVRRLRGLRVGVPLDTRQIAATLSRYFGSSDAVFVPLASASVFFEGREADLDAYIMPAEAAAAETLLHPEFAVVVPQPNPVRVPFAFGVALDGEDLADAINQWIVFADSEGAIPRAYDYWVLGQGAKDERPRWSILRDVLGWRRWPVTH